MVGGDDDLDLEHVALSKRFQHGIVAVLHAVQVRALGCGLEGIVGGNGESTMGN